MSVGHRIVLLRKKQGLTQAALAKAADLSASAIAMYETDRRTPDARSTAKLAAALGVSATNLSSAIDLSEPEKTVAVYADETAGGAVSERPAAAQAPSEAGVEATNGEVTDQGTADEAVAGTTQLTLTLEEARVILFLRMNPQAMSFIQTYITAGNQRRTQLEKTWRLINEFQ